MTPSHVLYFVSLLVVCAMTACGMSTRPPATDDPACLYELTVSPDGGAASFVVQGFGTLTECRAYERQCNSATWPNATALRCTECCDTCGL